MGTMTMVYKLGPNNIFHSVTISCDRKYKQFHHWKTQISNNLIYPNIKEGLILSTMDLPKCTLILWATAFYKKLQSSKKGYCAVFLNFAT